jgi:hypothetical protein
MIAMAQCQVGLSMVAWKFNMKYPSSSCCQAHSGGEMGVLVLVETQGSEQNIVVTVC